MATRVTVSKVKVHGEPRYRVNYTQGGKRKRQLCKSKAVAEAEAARLRSEITQTGTAWNALPAADRSKLMDAWTQARKAGVDLSTVIQGATNGNGNGLKERSLQDVLSDLLTAKKAAGRAEDYRTVLELTLNQFVKGRETLPIHKVTLGDVERFLDGKTLASRSTNRARLSTMFKFALRRGHVHENPCARLEAVTYDTPSPVIFTRSQFARCVLCLRRHPRAFAWFVLTTLCGLRPEEATQTTRRAINLDGGTVIVDGQTSKVRQRRVVTPRAEAVVMLGRALDLGAELPIPDQLRKRTIHRLRRVLHWKTWPKDVTRHTAASYWLASTRNADFVADQLGHSAKTLKRNYAALVTPAQAEDFWSLVVKLNRKIK